jgi:hypothetical protein
MPSSLACPPWLVRMVAANDDQASSSSSSKGGGAVLTTGTATIDTGYRGGGGEGGNAADPQGSSSTGQSRLAARGHWRPAEDIKLRELVALYGPQNWNLIAEKLDGRSGMYGQATVCSSADVHNTMTSNMREMQGRAVGCDGSTSLTRGSASNRSPTRRRRG